LMADNICKSPVKLTMFIIGNILQNQDIFRAAKADN